ncbi:(2Fe-2S)-binding protein [Roseobacter sp. EG26]|uniref:(2Fe-2S)-binding protein n=1 Tax=Roseobacter sp. EG26 TaxID=3412477 RepID=UPI003CE5C044
MNTTAIELEVNGRKHSANVPPRKLLSDFVRQDLALPGTHVGCEHGVCGACTILMDGKAVRACLMFAVQADGASLTTVEGLSKAEELHPIQHAFWEEHGLQCGFCTPGMLAAAHELLSENNDPTDEEIREAISGNLCRCTGYEYIIDAIRTAAKKLRVTQASGASQNA